MILKVARLGFPSLRTAASPVPADRIKTREFQQLIDDMIETMYEYSGVGLAAPAGPFADSTGRARSA